MSFLAANTQDGFGEHRDKKYPTGLQTATKTVAFATKNINLRVKFLLRSPLTTIYI